MGQQRPFLICGFSLWLTLPILCHLWNNKAVTSTNIAWMKIIKLWSLLFMNIMNDTTTTTRKEPLTNNLQFIARMRFHLKHYVSNDPEEILGCYGV